MWYCPCRGTGRKTGDGWVALSHLDAKGEKPTERQMSIRPHSNRRHFKIQINAVVSSNSSANKVLEREVKAYRGSRKKGETQT